MTAFCRTALLLLSALLAASCAPVEKAWTQPGKSAADLGVDRADCRTVARDQGLAASFDRTRVIGSARDAAFERCMASKGWTVQTPLANGSRPDASPAFRAEGSRVEGFGVVIEPPAPLCLDHNGSTRKRFVFTSPGGTSMTVVLQEGGPFLDELHPVPPPFFPWDRARRGPLSWVSFAGKRTGESLAGWTAGFAARLLLGGKILSRPTARITVVVAAPLAPPSSPPPPGLRLTSSQSAVMEEFTGYWASWAYANLIQEE